MIIKYIKQHFLLISFLLLVFITINFLIYNQIFSEKYMSDTQPHIVFLYHYFYGLEDYYIPHPLWHYMVYLTSLLLSISIEYSAIIISSFLMTFWTYIIYHIIQSKLHLQKSLLIIITFTIIIIAPLCLSWHNIVSYLGQNSPNIWHNITLWMVKPFALLSMLSLIYTIQYKENKYYIFSTITIILSIFAKPSFIIIFLPALFIFAILKKITNKHFYIFLLIISIISILAYQFIHTFNEENSKVIFDFLGVWSKDSQDIPHSILLALTFPLLFLSLELKIINDNYILLSWLQIFIGILFYISLAQTGKYYTHSNFAWNYMIAMSFLYVFSIIKFFEIYATLHKIKKYLLLSIQVTIGIYYFLKVLQGQNPPLDSHFFITRKYP